MQGNFKNCLALVLKSEGGFVNDPRDSGGATNHGVTQSVWEAWTGHKVDEKFMKNLTEEQVAPLYEMKYWRTAYCEVLPVGLDLLVFSMAVNSGCGRSVKLLQRAVGCVEDGVIGQNTLAKIKQSNVEVLINKFSDTRKTFMKH